jgi:serine/threonine protein kinase
MEKYNIKRKLASGSYGDIFIASVIDIKVNNNDVVIKKLFIKDDLENENCKLINTLNNKYFVNFIEKIDNNIIYEYFNGNTLDYEMYNLNIKDIEFISKQIIDFLYILEKKNYYYLDLNMNNILINSNKKIKIIDYSTITHKTKEIKNKIGTYYFVPPEYINDNLVIKNKFDIFSLGIILFILIFKYMPIKKLSDYKKKCLCNNNCLNEECLIKTINNYNKLKNNELLFKFIVKCLKFNFNKRITINELHQLLKSN